MGRGAGGSSLGRSSAVRSAARRSARACLAGKTSLELAPLCSRHKAGQLSGRGGVRCSGDTESHSRSGGPSLAPECSSTWWCRRREKRR